jgi:DNA-binding winged helix-turn-helix (wHTH) protein/tetratricopeptide (TPR) repeat protein
VATAPKPQRAIFDVFEFNLETGELSKYGTRIRLQEQPSRILRILLSRTGELVSREELQRELWPSGVFTDYEHGLHRAVNKIRTALGDTAATPRFLQTEARRGYRFISPVQMIVGPERGTPTIATPEGSAGPLDLPASPAHPRGGLDVAPSDVKFDWRRSGVRIGVLAAALVMLATLDASFSRREPPSFSGFQRREFVLVSPFDNRTGESLLDGTIDFTLARELSESEFVNVAPPQRVRDVLTLMKRPVDTPLNAELAREMCLRDPGIRAFITGRVDKIASSYVLSASLVDPATGTTVRSWTEHASAPAQLLPAVHRLSDAMRRQLGETLTQEGIREGPLQKVTTPSLEALKLYSEAIRRAEDGTFDGDANRLIDPLTKAVEYDPSFASAQNQLATALARAGHPAQASEHFEAAMRLADGVTDRERWFIQGSYYYFHHPDAEKAIIAYEELLHRYPDDVTALRRLLFLTGQPALGYRAAELRPNNLGINAWAWLLAVETGNVAIERRYYQRSASLLSTDALEDSPGAVVVKLARAMDDVNRNDLQATQAELKNVAASFQTLGPKARSSLAFHLGNFYCYLGELREAEHWFGSGGSGGVVRGAGQLAYARGGPRMLAQLKLAAGDPNVVALLATLGESSELRNALAVPQEPVYRLILEGADAMAHGNRQDAIAKLRRASVTAFYIDQKLAAANLLAQALEQSGDLVGAADMLAAATSSRLLPALNLPVWANETRLHLARLYRKLGRDADAERIERGLGTLLAGADPDFAAAQELRRLGAAKRAALASPFLR